MSIHSPLDWLVYEERNRESNRRANAARSRRQVLRVSVYPRSVPLIYRTALVRLGRVMVTWGERLQSRYGRINEQFKEISAVANNTERQTARP